MKLFFTDKPDCGVKGIYFEPETTLEKYEANRNIKPTIFQPEYLSQYTKIQYIPKNGVATNQNVSSDLFDRIVKVKQTGSVIHAIGYRNLIPTFLILRK
jgi:hypothetical protein